MLSQPLRAGVIGLGIGNAHCEGYQHNPDITLAAICDANEVRLKERAEKFGVAEDGCFTDYRDMLANARLDIVSVCLPNSLHAEATISCLEAGAHVICEKPLALSTFEVQDMLRAAKMNDRHVMVAYNYRFRADMQWIKGMIDSGAIGEVYHVEAWWRRETGIPGWYSQGQMIGGGALMDLGVHVLDLSLYALGFPAVHTVSGDVRSHFGGQRLKVMGPARWYEPDSPDHGFAVDDGAVGFIRLAGGAHIVLHATWAEHRAPKEDLVRVEFEGTKGTLVLNIPNYTRDDTVRFYTEMNGVAVTVTPAIRWDGKFGHEGLIAESAAALRENRTPPTEGGQGLVAVRILEAMYHSSKSGREVVFETQPDQLA